VDGLLPACFKLGERVGSDALVFHFLGIVGWEVHPGSMQTAYWVVH
jgi:hypothetical protein